MQFRIADTFTDSLAKLTGEEQKAVKTTAFDLQMNPAHPGLKFHKLDEAKDTNFWSVRVNRDIRLIIHKTASNLLLCYVDHHDKAYKWAERRKLETHPKTGAAQFVEIKETIREIIIPTYVQETVSKPKLFADLSDEELLTYGVPAEWITEVKQVDEDALLDLSDHLPAEAAEALLDLAVGIKPEVAPVIPATVDPFDHPDALRRFRVIDNVDELEQALNYPWEKWTIFLHPKQRDVVQKSYNGPARISGTAGTGKTIVALHRAVFLAKTNPDTRVLLTTFSDTLARSLQIKLKRLLSPTPLVAERIDVHSMKSIGERLFNLHIGKPQIIAQDQLQEIVALASQEVAGHTFSLPFLLTEWTQVVDAWQLHDWEAYKNVTRLGRKTRLPVSKRQKLWEIFEIVRDKVTERGLLTYAQLFDQLAHKFESLSPPFDFVILDEAQDVSVAQLRFLVAISGDRPDNLFFTGDLGQRIFQQPFSWKSLGVNIQGRSATLKINYRTSHQIRKQADLLLGPEISDVDGNVESRKGAISVFNGPRPEIKEFESPEEEASFLAERLEELIQSESIAPEEIGIFVRSEGQLGRAQTAASKANLAHVVLDQKLDIPPEHAAISTMHLAKGLEFRVVIVMACDDEIIPSMERIEQVSEESDLAEVYHTERHLLYVACTRARDRLIVTSGDIASEFLDDLRSK